MNSEIMKKSLMLTSLALLAEDTSKHVGDFIFMEQNDFPSIDDMISQNERIQKLAEECRNTPFYVHLIEEDDYIQVKQYIKDSARGDKRLMVQHALLYFYLKYTQSKNKAESIACILVLFPVVAHYVKLAASDK